MLSIQGYAAMTAGAALQPFLFTRRDVGPHDVLIAITHCGICHSDVHQARDEWGGSIFPMVPGHEIVGAVTQFHVGETAGVGCFVDSCRTCHACREGLEQYCEAGMLLTYNGRDKDGQPTQDGYSTTNCRGRELCTASPSGSVACGSRSALMHRHYNVLSAVSLGSRQISQAGSCGVRRARSYGRKDRQGVRHKSHRVKYNRTKKAGCDAIGSRRLRSYFTARDVYTATAAL
jgi:hypothetical protein